MVDVVQRFQVAMPDDCFVRIECLTDQTPSSFQNADSYRLGGSVLIEASTCGDEKLELVSQPLFASNSIVVTVRVVFVDLWLSIYHTTSTK